MKAKLTEAQVRILIAALQPVLTLSRFAQLSLDDLQQIVALAYFEEYRERGMSLENIARRMNKSVRTVAALSQQAKTKARRLEPGEELTRARAIVQMLDEEESLLLRDILARFAPAASPLVKKTLKWLVDENVIAKKEQRYFVSSAHLSLIHPDMPHLIHGARRFFSSLSPLLYWRFFRTVPDSSRAFARTFQFKMKASAWASITNDVSAFIRDRILRLDHEAGDDSSESDVVDVSVQLAASQRPDHPAWKMPARFK